MCNFFKQIYIINFKLRSNLLLLKKSFFPNQKCRGSNVNIITNHFFKKMAGNKKEEDLSSISKMMFMCSECYIIIIYEVSEYILQNHYKSLRRKNIDMCQYVVNGNDYHLNIKRVGKRERESFRFKSFLYQWEMPPGFCLQAQSNKDPVVYIFP